MKRLIALIAGAVALLACLPLEAGAKTTATVNAGAAANDGVADHFTIALSGDAIDVTVNGVAQPSIPLIGLGSLVVQGSADDDTLTVDESGGLIALPGGIQYDGAAGFDSLAFTGSTDPTVSTTLTVGPSTGGGTTVHSDGKHVQKLVYDNLEPVLDTAAGTLTLNGTNGDDSIDYRAGVLAGDGLVSVNNNETYEFKNKTSLTLNANAGDDVINLNYALLAQPTGLTGTINVNGGDPTASDTLIVNGIPAVLDNLRDDPTDVGAGTVINDAAPQPNVNYTGIEHLRMVVQLADGDGVRADGTAGNDAFIFNQGDTPDAGSMNGTMDQNNATGHGPFAFVPLTWTGANPVGNDFDLNFFVPGGLDTLRFNGTSANDTLKVQTGEAGGNEFSDTVDGTLISRVEGFSLAGGSALGLGGNDSFVKNVLFSTALISLQGGAGADDHLSYLSTTGATTVDLGAKTITATSPAQGATSFSGIESIDETSIGGGSTLKVNGTPGADSFAYTPTGASAGTIARTGSPLVNFSGVGSTLTIDPLGGSNAVQVLGTAGADSFDAQLNPTTTVQVGATKAVAVPSASLSLLSIGAGAGIDTINVSTFNTTPMNVFVDGDIPIGKKDGDLLNVVTHGKAKAKNQKGAAGSGVVNVAYSTGAGAAISASYAGVEKVKIIKS